jgi:energy-coupling factor transporter ATP-binding protein EcfA2/energy-coupling factor transporter transmembrane protein EcfT
MTIAVDHITVYPRHKTDSPILNDVSCECKPGTVTLIIGQTGSGKSTLLLAMAGLIPLYSGTIHYGGSSLWTGKRMNEAVKFKPGLVFQYPERQLFAENIRKEFAYSLRPLRLSKREQAERIRQTMEQLQLPGQLLDESAFTLSDGQKRKIATATTLAADPEWLLLDEPTAGIDPQSVPLLLDMLRSRKRRPKGGVVVVSHDLDTFLPLADQVLVLKQGRLTAQITPQQLCSSPDILLSADVGLPTAVQISGVLSAQGIVLLQPAVTPDETAQIIMQALAGRSATVEAAEYVDARCADDEQSNGNSYIAHHAVTGSANQRVACSTASRAPLIRPNALTPAETLHPITKWLLYLLLSTGMLLQHGWPGIGLAGAITVLCIFLSRVHYRTLLKPAKPLLFFIMISGIISGLTIEFGPSSLIPQRLDFSLTAAEQTVKQLSVIFFIMLLGVLFAATTGGRMMQRGLEQAFSYLEKLKLPVSVFTFSAALLLKFIPHLFAEVDRMSLITRARGKSNVKDGSVRVRDVPMFMIPLILSLMKHAEDMAFALEARGYKIKRLIGASSGKILWLREDWYCACIGIVLLGVFIVVSVNF